MGFVRYFSLMITQNALLTCEGKHVFFCCQSNHSLTDAFTIFIKLDYSTQALLLVGLPSYISNMAIWEGILD